MLDTQDLQALAAEVGGTVVTAKPTKTNKPANDEQIAALRAINAAVVEIEGDLKRYHMPADPINGKHKVIDMIVDDIKDLRKRVVNLRDAKDPNDETIENATGLIKAVLGNIGDVVKAAKQFMDAREAKAAVEALAKFKTQALASTVTEDDFYGTLATVLSSVAYGINQYYNGH
jgi:isopropylmalate/homocitrate/citramalate synthase